MGVSEEYVDEEMRKIKPPLGREQKQESDISSQALSRQENIELYTLALLLQGKTKKLWEDVEKAMVISDVSFVPVQRIFKALKEYTPENQDFSIQTFIRTLPSELIPIIDKAYLWDISSIVDDEQTYEEEWKKTLRELHRTIIRKKIQDLNRNNRIVEDPSVQERLSEFTKELSALEKSDSF